LSDNPQNTADTLRSMAKIAMFEGKLNDVQLKNLQMFPFVFFNGVLEVKLDYDLDVGQAEVTYEQDVEKLETKYDITPPVNNTRVTYWLTLNAGQNDQLDKRFEALKNSVTTVFWKGIALEVYFNDKSVYKGKT
jgi:hypothetical protein